MNVHINCCDCKATKMISRDDWERYYQDDEDSFICSSCQLDIMDGYLPLETKVETGKQYDNSQGTF